MSTQGSDYERALRALKASRLRKAGLKGAYASADCRLGSESMRRAAKGRGTYLYGLPGRGKTYAAACAVRLAVESGRSARLVASQALLQEVRDGFDGGDRGALARARGVWLLALDDLGVERPTEWAMETLSGLLDARVAEGLPTIVTSNYALGDLAERWGDMPGMRLASRLGGACERVEVTGRDRRMA